jgi:hypothetical protein
MAASAGLAPLHLLELPFDGGAQAQFQRDRMQFVDDLAHVADATIQRGQRLRGAPVQQRLRGACAGVQHGDVQLSATRFCARLSRMPSARRRCWLSVASCPSSDGRCMMF